MLVKQGLRFESEEHLQFTDALFEKINYYAIQASSELAKEKGSYQEFTGSDWQSGAYFTKRSYVSDSWKQLEALVQKQGMRNAWLMAIAPTSSTSIIAGTTAGVDRSSYNPSREKAAADSSKYPRCFHSNQQSFGRCGLDFFHLIGICHIKSCGTPVYM